MLTFPELCRQKGFRTGSRLAERTGKTQATVSQFWLGKALNPTWNTLEPIADALGVEPREVMRAVRNTKAEAA